MPTLDQIARGLQGFGAGVAGRGPEFLRGLEEDRRLDIAQQAELDGNRKTAMLIDNRVLLDHLKKGRVGPARQLLINRISDINQLKGDPSDSAGQLRLIDSGNIDGAINESQIFDDEAVIRGFLDPFDAEPTAAGRDFSRLTEGLSEDDVLSARRIELGLDPRAVGSAVQTITDLGTAGRVAATEETISQGKERGKSKAQLTFKPMIERAVKLAEQEAKARGETLTSLKRSEAALPGLTEAVDQLKELAPIATSTLGGKLFDAAIKETGFGSTKGADARAKFIAIVNNQVLPLLKETFGAAFTAKEGEALKATMGDPDASPGQKMAQLEAFINQKKRDITTKRAEVGVAKVPVAVTSQEEFDALPSGATFIEDGQTYRKP